MNDHPSSAAESVDRSAEAERQAVCEDCQHAQADLLAEVGQAPADAETAEEAELSAWLEEHLPHLEPRALVLAAAADLQTDERKFTPDYKVTDENPADVAPDIELLVIELVTEERNAITTGQIDDGVPAKVPAEVGEESTLLKDEADLIVDRETLSREQATEETQQRDQLQAKNEKQDRNVELIALQPRFLQLLADGLPTSAALRRVLSEAEHIETKRHLDALLHRVTALTVALPGKADLIQTMLRSAPLDLAAPTVTASFVGFLTAAENNQDFSDADRATIRRVVGQSEHDMHTGTKVYEAALVTTTDPTTGEPIPLHTADNKAEVLPGVHAFTETGRNVILEMKTPRRRMTLDVTGYDGATIGLVAEAMGFQAHLEELKATAFVHEVYGVDFGLLGDPSFDPLSLIDMRQRLTALVGGGAGYDGSIFDPRDKSGLILAQMRLTSPINSAESWGQDLHAAQAHIKSLGLDNLAVLEEFGRYTRLHYQIGAIAPEALKGHLHGQFPDLVGAP